jgi:hypothetical protein
MNIRSTFWVSLSLFCSIGLLSCAGNGPGSQSQAPPVVPDITNAKVSPVESTGHFLWAYYAVFVDPETLEVELIPVRQVAGHWNTLTWLEQSPCATCLKLESITPNPDGTLNVNVSIRHPFDNPNLTGFDVRGIAMFNGSHEFPGSGLVMSDRGLNEGELVNADGFTTLYNPTTAGHGFEGYFNGKLATTTAPSSTLNAFKRFITSNPDNLRNAFYPWDKIVVPYQIDMPNPPNQWVFGYAVDACWAPPINKPVDDPMTDFDPEANCPEGWKINTHAFAAGMTGSGGTTMLLIDVYDWQGKDVVHPVLVECPELFDGTKNAYWKQDGIGFVRYVAEIANENLAPPGSYTCLISQEAQENDPVGKPWLDLTVYRTLSVDVAWYDGYPIDVTPPWLNFSPQDICVDGNYAYVAGNINGLHIFDITDPENPVWANKVDTPGYATGVAVSGGMAYVADGNSGLQIIDIDPPESAYIVNSVDISNFAYGIAVSASYVYIAAYQLGDSGWDSALKIISIDPPESAYIVNSVDTTGNAGRVAVSGGYAYIAESYSGLEIVDIDPPESANAVNLIETQHRAEDVVVSGDYAYVAASQEPGEAKLVLEIIDIDLPESAYIYNEVEIPTENTQGGGLAVSGGCAYVVHPGYGSFMSEFAIIDIDPPESAYMVNSVTTPDNTGEVAVSDGYAYTVGGTSLKVFDIDPAESLYNVGSIYSPASASRVRYSDGFAYISDTSSGLQIIDVSVPESPYVVKLVNTVQPTGALAVGGGYACLANSISYGAPDSRIAIIDIDPPESAYIVSEFGTCWIAQYVEMNSGYAYYGTGHGSVIMDIDPPESPQYAGSLSGDPTQAIAVSGGLAYVSHMDDYEEPSSILVYDVDPPESAEMVDQIFISAGYAIEISGGYAYTAGFKIIDIDPLESAYLVKKVTTPGTDSSIALSDGYAYVTDGNIQIIGIDPPESAYIVSSFDMADSAHGIAVSGNYAYVASGAYGLRIIRLW